MPRLVGPRVLLVGARAPQNCNQNAVCIEPEDGEWPLELFTGLLASIESTVNGHHLQNILYGDVQSMRDKPEVIRRDSVTTAVRESLSPYDAENGVRSFCGGAYPVGDYYVVPVIQIPEWVFLEFPPREPHGSVNVWFDLSRLAAKGRDRPLSVTSECRYFRRPTTTLTSRRGAKPRGNPTATLLSGLVQHDVQASRCTAVLTNG